MGKYRSFKLEPIATEETPSEKGFTVTFANSKGAVEEIDFDCLPEMPAIAASLAAGRRPDGRVAGILEIIRACLTPDAEIEFDALLSRKDVIIQGGQFQAIAQDLWEQYTGRPTESPDASANGHGPTATSTTES